MRARRTRGWLAWAWTALLALAPAPFVRAAKSSPPEAKLTVDGAGWLRDREFRNALERLLDVEQKEFLDANAIEDAAVILSSSLGEEGFQTPRIEIIATLEEGTEKRFVFDPTFANPLPRPLRAREVKFQITPGIRSHIAFVEVHGLTAITPRTARGYFRSEGALMATARANAYSRSRVSRAADALSDELRLRGYAESEVRAEKSGEKDGAVTVRVDVREGARWEVASVRYQRDEAQEVELPAVESWLGQPWSTTLQEDIREAIRQAYYREGYPDIGVHVEAEAEPADGGKKDAHVIVTIVPGPHVTLGQVRFEGNVTTRHSVLRRRVRLDAGDPFDVVALERARYRISRLGVFEVVDLRYAPEEGTVRDAIFRVREGPRYETHLLFGYGSYEQARAGVEHRQMNIFGLAHQSRLELVQSLKSTNADYTYSVPEIFGESIDGTARLFGLQRDEVAFDRKEYGLNLFIKRNVWQIDGEFTAGYTFKALRNEDSSLSTEATDESQVIAASMNVGLSSDRRDNPLRPRHGYHWIAQVEAADPMLGGEVTYQKYELAAAYHTRWGEGRWIHVATSHGLITTIGANDRGLPVNERFYPGGDDSIRGYQRGEAAPRGADGRFIGAKSYGLFNVEIEQALTPSWSIVAFGDALGMAQVLRDFPYKERLYSAGLGLRYQTLIGPIRIEYGRNLNPRPDDPSGTWHFSIGYPF